MGITPSGTDVTQVKKWAESYPYYLSIIVNNKFEFNALLAVKTEKEITTVSKIRKKGDKFYPPIRQTVKENAFDIYYPTVYIPASVFELKDRMDKIQHYSSVPTYTYPKQVGFGNNNPAYRSGGDFATSRKDDNRSRVSRDGNSTVYHGKDWYSEPESETDFYDKDLYEEFSKDYSDALNYLKKGKTEEEPVSSSAGKKEGSTAHIHPDNWDSGRGNAMPKTGRLVSISGPMSEYDDTTVERCLADYCFLNSEKREQPFTPQECFEFIELDMKGFGVPREAYISYLSRKGVFYSVEKNQELISLLSGTI
jgi:hypothetical protein